MRFVKKRVKSWSYSSYSAWKTCSARFYYERLLKLPQPPNKYALRGIEIHAKGEMYLKGAITGVPDEFKNFAGEMRNLKKHGAAPEADWCVTRDWQPCGPTDWDVVWGRGKIDAHVEFEGELVVVDFKSGRIRDYRLQAETYAAISQPYYPEAEQVTVEFWYVDQPRNEEVPGVKGPYNPEVRTYTKNEVDALKKKWDRVLKPMFADTKFHPSPGYHCRYCNFRSDRPMVDGSAGPCTAWKRG